MMQRRNIVQLLAAAALAAAHAAAGAQLSADKPVRLLVGYQAGGQADQVARLTARKLGEILGGPVIVENRAGANGMIAADAVARAPADGHTLLVGGAANLTVAPVVEKEARYDPLADFVPIGRIVRVPMLVVARAGLPVETGAQLVEYARSNPGALTFAAPAANTQLALESLKHSEALQIVVVPYKGSAPAALDLLAGRVDFTLLDAAAIEPHVRSGAVRVIAAAGRSRSPAFPLAPTMIEQGVADFDWDTWQALVAPKGTPAEVVARLQRALGQALASPGFRQQLEQLGFVPIDEGAAQFSLVIGAELERNRRLAGLVGAAGR
jgi:tripartite-type tricarboxylate transporter receptor subunit TctC